MSNLWFVVGTNKEIFNQRCESRTEIDLYAVYELSARTLKFAGKNIFSSEETFTLSHLPKQMALFIA